MRKRLDFVAPDKKKFAAGPLARLALLGWLFMFLPVLILIQILYCYLRVVFIKVTPYVAPFYNIQIEVKNLINSNSFTQWRTP
jgi:hypothetical protein